MTYPPQDPGAVPPGAPDPYGQSQPAPPPAGGYAPGQVGADPSYPAPSPTAPPTTQLPASGYQPDPGAVPYYPQPGYDPNQPYNPYQQYGPPPVQATTKGGGGTALLIIGVVLLMALGAVGGYFWLGGDREEGELSGAEDDTSTSQESDPGDGGGSTGEEEPEEEAPGPSGTGLSVTSLGSVTPIPAGEWAPYYGPGESNEPMTDSEGYALHHTEEWISFFGVGLYSGAVAQYDPTDLRTSAASAAEVWLTGAFGSVQGYTMGEIAYQDVEVDGKTGVLATWRNSWTSTQGSTDTFEDTAMLVVDVDGVNGFLGIASIAQSGTDSYQSAVDALLATDFDAETA
ncbi:DUF3824 domain-containing protein [Glycomyces terrestris]|uniref:Uncharacterized protein n=1 Tax=Glycomyces terrestris TaxID=2493553 RepID=A0A426US57_9ACTN|nr:DUF3824 domain-containing protein [Glycomyces terrestris]RRR96080.1 hypothetical protein EIW28_22720 [Glycomyces terrestris]